MRFSRLDLLMLAAGLAGTGACQGAQPPAEPAELVESAALPTAPADSTVSRPAPAAQREPAR